MDPRGGGSRSQRAVIARRGEGALGDSDLALLRLGALVALGADRYGSPADRGRDSERYSARGDLKVLEREFDELGDELGESPAYDDFGFLLRRMALSAREWEPDDDEDDIGEGDDPDDWDEDDAPDRDTDYSR